MYRFPRTNSRTGGGAGAATGCGGAAAAAGTGVAAADVADAGAKFVAVAAGRAAAGDARVAAGTGAGAAVAVADAALNCDDDFAAAGARVVASFVSINAEDLAEPGCALGSGRVSEADLSDAGCGFASADTAGLAGVGLGPSAGLLGATFGGAGCFASVVIMSTMLSLRIVAKP